MDLFSDREKGKQPLTIEKINIPVWNGIVAIIEEFISQNAFSKIFPEKCPDGLGICGFNEILFYDKIKAIIPAMKFHKRIENSEIHDFDFNTFEEKSEKIEIDTFPILDFIEYCHEQIYDTDTVGNYHEFFGHYHYVFNQNDINRSKFRNEINQLFERNGIAYNLQENGMVIRLIQTELKQVIERKINTTDNKLNQLIKEATDYLLVPKLSLRKNCIEKIWDAFERLKTYYSNNKKQSIEQLLQTAANGNLSFGSELNEEARKLTEIGNKYQIRHFETDKIEITDNQHIDYLFFRMFVLIDLLTKKLEGNE